MQAKEAQAAFLGPQLPHAWVEEENIASKTSSQPQGDAYHAVMEAIKAYGASLRKNLKPVARYREPVPKPEAGIRAKLLRDAEEQMRQNWLEPQLHGKWNLDSTPTPDMNRQRGREIIAIEKKGHVKVSICIRCAPVASMVALRIECIRNGRFKSFWIMSRLLMR